MLFLCTLHLIRGKIDIFSSGGYVRKSDFLACGLGWLFVYFLKSLELLIFHVNVLSNTLHKTFSAA